MERTHLDVEDEEWAPLEAWDDWRIVGNSDAVTEAISHRELIREVWPEFRTMTDAALDRMLGETMAEMSPLEIENFWKGLGRVAQSVGKTLVQAAPAVLPVVGGAVGTLIGGPAGTALGSTLGRFAGQAVGQAAGRGRAAVPRRPHGAAVQAGPPTAHPGPAGAGAAPPSAVPAGSSGALGQLMALIQDPALLQRLLGALMGSASPAPIGNTETSAGIGGFLNAVECLAAEAAREVHQLANASGGFPEYLLDEHGAPAVNPQIPEERARRLMELLNEAHVGELAATDDERWVARDDADVAGWLERAGLLEHRA